MQYKTKQYSSYKMSGIVHTKQYIIVIYRAVTKIVLLAGKGKGFVSNILLKFSAGFDCE